MKKVVFHCFFISMSKICSADKCSFSTFEDNEKCIFHCEKNDWFEEKRDADGKMYRDWIRSNNDGRIAEFWKLIREKKMAKED